MKSLILSATDFEVYPIINQLLQQEHTDFFTSEFYDLQLSGVGLLETSIQLTSRLAQGEYQSIINLGVAGAYNPNYSIGDVVEVVSEQYGDLGGQHSDGSFLTLDELNLKLPSVFNKNKLFTTKRFEQLKSARSISVNQVAGTKESIRDRQNQFAPDIENMEGLAVFRVCEELNIPKCQLRAISNRVEPRNKEAWNLKLAIDNLSKFVIPLLVSRVL